MPPKPAAPVDGPESFQAATGVSRETRDRLARYVERLTRWNRAINLVAPRSLPEVWHRHVLDSAQLWPLLPEAPAGRARRLVDLGSGAGFPGLVLAILGAGEVHLIESDTRKATFLREAIRETGAPAQVHATRIADAPEINADVVTARALAPLSELLDHAAGFLADGGVALFHKGQRAPEELTAARKAWKIAVQQFPSQTDPGGHILHIEVRGRGESTK